MATVMISHERLDRLVGQVLPSSAAVMVADCANRRTAANYDAVVCTTGFAREEFDRIGAENVATVPLGVDLEQFRPRRRCADMRSRWAAPQQTLLVHCGRLSVEKHAHRSIVTLAALRDSGGDAQLVPVGPRRSCPAPRLWPRSSRATAGRPLTTMRTRSRAVTSVIDRPEPLRRNSARQRAEQFTWPRAAAGMLDALGAR